MSTRRTRTGPSDLASWRRLYETDAALYDRLIAGERLHPSVLDWFPASIERCVEVGAGTGRLTLPLQRRAARMVAVEPAAAMRRVLASRVRCPVVAGSFDAIPVATGWATMAVACSAFTPDPEQGGEPGLREMERVCAPGGTIVIVWPNGVDWLAERGFEYVSFPGDMAVEFASVTEAREVASIFYPSARVTSRFVPYEDLGMNAPRDLCFKCV